MKLVALFAIVLIATSAIAGSSTIINTPHNLSSGGPGGVRASSEQEVCVFCHTPHKSSGVQPLWNRQVIPQAYKVYSSNSLQAKPNQPTGTSKLCLSCHDGTIALGSVLSRDQHIGMAGGVTTMPPGSKNLGTDLSDDHPISFRYDSTLAGKNPKLKDPALLPQTVRLDRNQEVQCTTCHNPHDNTNDRFLVMDNSRSQLCNSCHSMGTTDVPGHIDCASCHQPHSAPSGPYLLKAQKPTDTCLPCHSGGTTWPRSRATTPALPPTSPTPFPAPPPAPTAMSRTRCAPPPSHRRQTSRPTLARSKGSTPPGLRSPPLNMNIRSASAAMPMTRPSSPTSPARSCRTIPAWSLPQAPSPIIRSWPRAKAPTCPASSPA